jgi:hypothetical protein
VRSDVLVRVNGAVYGHVNRASCFGQVNPASPVTASLMYLHPESNAELEFLFPKSGKLGKRYKRRRGERGVKSLASIGDTLSIT